MAGGVREVASRGSAPGGHGGARRSGGVARGSDAEAGFASLQSLLPAPAPGSRPLTRRISSGRRLEARAVPEVLGEVRSAGHADQG